MKPHIPWRTVETNPFNKDMFKGHQEKINDWDLDTTLYVYEPQSLADLGDNASELEYQKVWNKFKAGGHINIYLVPYREMPEVKVEITSIGASYDGLDKDETIAAYTNVPMGDRPTKRFYSFKPLPTGVEPLTDLEIFEENNLTEVINNDSTLKQTTFTLNKFQVYDGGEGSYYRDVRFYHGVFKPENIDYIQVVNNVPTMVGGMAVKNTLGAPINTTLEAQLATDYTDGRVDLALFGPDGPYYLPLSFNSMYPQMMVPLVHETGINWMAPWAWEYDYAMAQWEGTYKWGWLDTGITQNEDDKPPSEGGFLEGEAVDLTDEFTANPSGIPGNSVPYRRLTDANLTETKKELPFFLPYTVEFALPSRLSSHGAGFVNDNSTSTEGSFFSYTDSSHNGARPLSIQGNWAQKNTIFALDNCYDPTIFTLGDQLQLWISEIQPGIYTHSNNYLDLVNGVLDENPIYQGIPFMSDLGVLDDINSKDVDPDIRKWNETGDWHLVLMPIAIEKVKETYSSDYLYGPSTPKIDLGAIDFNPAVLRTNATSPFFGKYIDEKKIVDLDNELREITLQTDEKDVSQIIYNYYAFAGGDIEIILWTKTEEETYVPVHIETLKNERAQGRNLSGGTVITWL